MNWAVDDRPNARARRFGTALVCMPWGALDRPALGISLLKAGLARRGHDCDIHYLNLPFAAQLGLDVYRWVQGALPHVAFAGEWTFAEALNGPRPDADRHYLAEHLAGKWRIGERDIARLQAVRAAAEPFLDWCLEAVDWQAYGAVGFTSTFEQNIASLALARRLRARWPKLTILFGGANWEGEMGRELHARFPFVDIAFSGEADESLPRVIDELAAGRGPDALGQIPGLVIRDGAGASRATPEPRAVSRMDDLPIPDYADYFEALERSGAAAEVVPTLLFETSRGCWWGAKNHCTFCGLNGHAMTFRSKSGERAIAELRQLVAAWPTGYVGVVDNILDMKYFTTFFPALIEAGLGVQLFWEVKANLSREQVAMLARAGVTRIQPGIESLSTRLLKEMRKGTTALRNVLLLRHCRQHGIAVDWNILHNVPGERPEDYRTMRAMLPAIGHLAPPAAHGPIRLDRFSPYHSDPEAYGLSAVRATSAYSALYPFGEEALSRIAYYFDFSAAPSSAAAETDKFLGLLGEWMRDPDPGNLFAFDDGSELRLVDTRRGVRSRTARLTGPARTAFETCHDIASLEAVSARIGRDHPDVPLSPAGVRALLERMVREGWMLADGDLYLSLATAPLSEPGAATREAAWAAAA